MKYVILALLAVTSTAAWSGSPYETAQDRAYTDCLISRKAYPPPPIADQEYCMREAGIENPGQDTLKEKWRPWRDCLLKNSARLDDRVSPATDIARAIIVLCSNEWKDYVRAWWLPSGMKAEVSANIEKYGADEGVQAVLLTRSALRDMKRQTHPENPGR